MKTFRKPVSTPRRLFLESLERREVLAGNVAVSLVGGALRVTGDSGDNVIGIFQQPNGRFNVVGLDDETITGPQENLIVRSILVNAGAGDDTVLISAEPDPFDPFTIVPAQVLGTTVVNGGTGGDTISVNVVGRLIPAANLALPSLSVTVDGGIQTTGMQDDAVAVVNTVTGVLTVNTYSGDDTIDIIGVISLTASINSGVAATSRDATDNDLVNIFGGYALTSTVSLGTSSNTDSGNTLAIDTGAYGTLTIMGGNGIDNIEASNVLAGLAFNIYAYGGADTITLNEVQTGLTRDNYQEFADLVIQALGIDVNRLPFDLPSLIGRLPTLPGSLTIFSGAGDDAVTLTNIVSTFNIYAYLEGGNDTLDADFIIAKRAYFNGGAGTNFSTLGDEIDAIVSLLLFEDQ
ncbi:hypothetical protein ETAA8_25820 [Anatilimnocola aggregata]|uniref:Uncharacterized protein n=1 Tax=Anatilimnocola aggregata TaxID=2528021 RepID=A0A517YBA1_9BACT|nr:hypothetical protein [Anatilimnocola aggregata]QDU27494.1 hypothetical protein ETAA8_25820 [Anatilimnocola aggregata]